MTLHVEGLRWHDSISVVGAPSRGECYGVVAPPRSWGRGIRNAARCTPSAAFTGYDDFLYRPDAQVKLEPFPLYLVNSLLEGGRILYRFSINQ